MSVFHIEFHIHSASLEALIKAYFLYPELPYLLHLVEVDGIELALYRAESAADADLLVDFRRAAAEASCGLCFYLFPMTTWLPPSCLSQLQNDMPRCPDQP